ncbi:MAG: hypothetical protein EA427_08990 [Spirochaetaceae bacterium]|nr:MAG: hypothetical protein EA427_08990 [Spirochaetaceae bacterium]
MAGRYRRVARLPTLVPAILLLFLLCMSGTLYAMGRGETDQDRARAMRRDLTPEEVVWRYALGTVVAEDHSQADRLQLGSYVRILEDALSDVPLRYLTVGEQRSWSDRIIRQERLRLRRNLDERTQTLDRGRLESGVEHPDNRWEEDTRVRELLESLRILGIVEGGPLRLPETARLELVRGEHQYRRILAGPAAAADGRNVDMLLYLTVVSLEDLLFLRIRSYNRLAGTDREIARIVATAEEMPRRLEDMAGVLTREVSGRELADLLVQVTDSEGMPEESARIRLNDTLVGVGRAEERFLLPGEYSVSIATGDGRQVSQSVLLTAGEQRRLLVELPPHRGGMIRLESDPPGAKVYQGALWSGETPLDVPRPTESREYTLSMKGYYDSRVQLGPDSPSRVSRNLVHTDTDWYGEVTDTRNRFYRSFGAFALSLSAPILLNGMYQNLGGLFPGGEARSDLTAEEQEKYLGRANTILVGYYVSFGLSTALFGNMVWRLTQYIRTAQEYHYR